MGVPKNLRKSKISGQCCATDQSECNAEQKQVKNISNGTTGTETEPHLNSELVNQFCSVFVFTNIE